MDARREREPPRPHDSWPTEDFHPTLANIGLLYAKRQRVPVPTTTRFEGFLRRELIEDRVAMTAVLRGVGADVRASTPRGR
jgi:hypothetical protein